MGSREIIKKILRETYRPVIGNEIDSLSPIEIETRICKSKIDAIERGEEGLTEKQVKGLAYQYKLLSPYMKGRDVPTYPLQDILEAEKILKTFDGITY